MNYNTYRNEELNCTKCKWKGLGSETFLSELSEIHTLRDIECPSCESIIHTFDLSKI